jgi:hypothetical protein
MTLAVMFRRIKLMHKKYKQYEALTTYIGDYDKWTQKNKRKERKQIMDF